MTQAVYGLKRASDLQEEQETGPPWSLERLRSRLTELVGTADSANISVAARLIGDAQHRGALAAWVATDRTVFFPPDLSAAGIDLAAMPVVWATAEGSAARSAERLVRTGAFGIIVIDLARAHVLSTAAQGRLLRLAEQHRTVVLILRRARSGAEHSGSLVSVRAQSSRERLTEGRFRCTIRNIKDKRVAPGWSVSEEFNGPPGLY